MSDTNEVTIVGEILSYLDIKPNITCDGKNLRFHIKTTETLYSDKTKSYIKHVEYHKVVVKDRDFRVHLANQVESLLVPGNILKIKGALRNYRYPNLKGVCSERSEVEAHTVELVRGFVNVNN